MHPAPAFFLSVAGFAFAFKEFLYIWEDDFPVVKKEGKTTVYLGFVAGLSLLLIGLRYLLVG